MNLEAIKGGRPAHCNPCSSALSISRLISHKASRLQGSDHLQCAHAARIPDQRASLLIFKLGKRCSLCFDPSIVICWEGVCDAKRRNISKKKTVKCGALGNRIYSQVITAGMINDAGLFPECVRFFCTVRPAEGPAGEIPLGVPASHEAEA